MRIDITNLTMEYGARVKALTDVSLRLESPGMIGLLGPNGAGKSTLMKLLVAGLLPTSGSITVNGAPLAKCEKELKSRLGYLPQSFGLYDELSVWQFLDYMSALKGIAKRRAAVDAAIAAANLEDKRKAKIRTLSGGQRQRVGIAQAILGNPDLLIFDEPTAGLDPEERIRFRNLFSDAAREKIVLLSTHIIDDVQSACNKLIVINRGRIKFAGTPEELIKSARGHVGVYIESAAPRYDMADGQQAKPTPGDELPANASSHHSMADGLPANPAPGCGLPVTATSRVNTAEGVACRVVADRLPPFALSVEPNLEDAYMYAIAGKEEAA